MKIYVAYTGGTIIMAPSSRGYVPDAAFATNITAQLRAWQPEHEFHVHFYERLIDSANATPADWQMIGEDLRDKWHLYDGFLILHGTDTMAYTSSALAFMFQNSSKPVIVTGSQLPMASSRNDVLSNVLGALDALLQGPPGVFLYFGGLLLEGARARKVNTSELQAFQSPNFLPRATLGVQWKWRQCAAPDVPELIQVPVMVAGSVTIIMLFPGIQAEHCRNLLGPEIKGAVLLSYGAGNGPDQNEELLELLQNAVRRGTVLVNVSQCGAGAVSTGVYAAGSALHEAGVVSGLDMTYEAAFTKLHFLIGLGKSPGEIRELIQLPMAFEVA